MGTNGTMQDYFVVTITCRSPHHHQQFIKFDRDLGRPWVERWAALMDGSSELYTIKPGEDSDLFRCVFCRARILAEVGP